MKTIKLSRGILLAVEGIDGAGKTTQATDVAKRLEEVGLKVTVTHEPTRGPWGQRLRESAQSGRLSPAEELEFFLKDRQEHVEKLIEPDLAAGKVVIVDRYYFSTAAYQGARGMDPAELLDQNEVFAPVPDVCALLEVVPKVGLERIRKRGDVANEFEKEEDLQKVADVFDVLERDCIHRLDANHSIEELTAQICDILYTGPLFNRLCAKITYKTKCEPTLCTERPVCPYIGVGYLQPLSLAASQLLEKASALGKNITADSSPEEVQEALETLISKAEAG